MSELSVHTLAVQLAWLLLGAALIGIVAHLLDLPYAVALVLSGLLVGQSHLTAVPTIAPDIVLFAFLPPLLFEASCRFETLICQGHVVIGMSAVRDAHDRTSLRTRWCRTETIRAVAIVSKRRPLGAATC